MVFYCYENRRLKYASERASRSGRLFSLNDLKEDDLDLVRSWRNKVRFNLVDQSIITPESQKKWFDSLNYDSSKYFVAKMSDKDITDDIKYGLFFLKGINFEDSCAESGGFIGLDEFLNGPSSFAASYLIKSIAFETLKLQFLITTVRQENRNAIRYNEFLGYKRLFIRDGLIHFALHNHTWFSKSNSIRKIVFGF